MIQTLYSIVLVILSPLLLCTLLKSKQGKPSVGARWKEYFGFTPKVKNTNPIWIHTVSVGETIAATPLIKAIKNKFPEQSILLTTTTTTGAEQAERLGDLVEHRYMPIDFAWCVRGFLKNTKPKCMLIMETELWPNTLHTVAKANIPVSVLNARLSERSCSRYQKLQGFFSLISSNLDQVLCQHREDAQRFQRLGLASNKVTITGSLKFDMSVPEFNSEQGILLREELGNERPIWVAASTHSGEDEQLLKAHQILLSAIPNALLIIVPRHPERFKAVSKLALERNLHTISRSSTHTVSANTQVYLGDTMGEMLTLISASDICFMAGSLVGDKVGGHNMLEPAALGKPILNGPSYFNFTDITKQLIDEKGLLICKSSEEIAGQLINLFNDEALRLEMGKNASKVVSRNQGAVQKTLDALSAVISR
ncbi:lipid IV(A) 3-deoxy-D-manno-octulosonic acid transferase [Vibrio superstes]|uniref:3-deoxy-D-manno-octulosonic acid transferase n=1 Tax=Vibrio superstes NBRC 103154 TaxID=1219062 RepID=A0A511QNQ9_9VIBR|nr:lipid IV(A) 3-deoxy-D-manno-octulosonic acid transferase [Vibrio superstes]GEM78162.1 3-deoxy-D-manno-octulosonic acid transferase [Vibrio superstes NBRC 103154]